MFVGNQGLQGCSGVRATVQGCSGVRTTRCPSSLESQWAAPEQRPTITMQHGTQGIEDEGSWQAGRGKREFNVTSVATLDPVRLHRHAQC
eukprot:366226-Chlamydomonas_euryale.AAC.27